MNVAACVLPVSRVLSKMVMAGGVAAVVLGAASDARAQTAAPATPPTVEERVTVIGVTPVTGSDTPVEQVAAPVQTATAKDIEKSGAVDLSAFLNRQMTSVHINETQGNPFQPDVNYRGYTASPLLGTPQGLSLYMDGVRLNQPFGQVVSWDLIPRIAISNLTLMPGSNPLFGLNTLGGALSLETKSGATSAGTSVQGLYGSDARRALEFEHGAARGPLNWYVAGNWFAEDGWRDDSPSDVRQVLGRLGWHRTTSDIALIVSHADTDLTGNGLQTSQFLASDYASVYTKPDNTKNRASLVNLTGTRRFSERLTASGNVYYRHIRTRTLNGDINEESLDQSVYQPGAAERAALAAAGYTGFPVSGATAANTPFPSWRCIGNVLLRDEPGEKCNGLLNRSLTTQHSGGAAGQITFSQGTAARRHRLLAGAALERSGAAFSQSTELGYLNPDRSVTGLGAFADGVTGGDIDGEPFDTRVDLDGDVNVWSVYASDTVSLGEAWHITGSGRYDRSHLLNRDGILPGGGPGSLDGNHTFARFNPAVGVTFNPTRALNLFAGYTEGSRSPTSIELGCADPEQPCKLPNALAGDPPLNQVVTRTFEAGARSGGTQPISWNAAFFRGENRDDILFVASEQTGFGYFRNFGNTRRQGIELGVSGRIHNVTVGAGYTFLDATFQSAEVVNGESNSSNDEAEEGLKGLEGVIEIEPGNRMPLIPRHLVKAYADVPLTSRASLELNVIAVSSSFARGNENNGHEADGVFYQGEGTTPGYSIANVGLTVRLTTTVQAVIQLNNVFDTRYSTGSQLGPNGFAADGSFVARPFPAVNGEFPVRHTTFEAPGAPRAFWVGLRFRR